MTGNDAMDVEIGLREFLEYVLRILVKHPDDVAIDYDFGDNRHVFRVSLNPEDIGRVIGKNGYTVSSIRSLLNAAAEREGARVTLKVMDDEPERGPER